MFDSENPVATEPGAVVVAAEGEPMVVVLDMDLDPDSVVVLELLDADDEVEGVPRLRVEKGVGSTV